MSGVPECDARLEPLCAEPTAFGPIEGRLADRLINCFLIPSLKALSAALSCDLRVPRQCGLKGSKPQARHTRHHSGRFSPHPRHLIARRSHSPHIPASFGDSSQRFLRIRQVQQPVRSLAEGASGSVMSRRRLSRAELVDIFKEGRGERLGRRKPRKREQGRMGDELFASSVTFMTGR